MLTSRLREFAAHYLFHTDTPAADEAAFRDHAGLELVRVAKAISVLIGTTVILLIPFDALTFDRHPDVVRLFHWWRPGIAAIMATGFVLLRLSSFMRRHAFALIILLGGLGMAASGYAFASHAGGVGGPFPFVACNFLFALVVMPIALAPRMLGTVWLCLCLLVAFVLRDPSALDHSWFRFLVVVFALNSFASIIFGHTIFHLLRGNFLKRRELAAAHETSERLLLNILPRSIADRLKVAPTLIADRLGEVTVLFADLCGFTTMSESLSPEDLVQLLNKLFSAFDELVERHGLEKIKTIGDAYMVAGGLPLPRGDHAEAIADLALEMQSIADGIRAPSGKPLTLRIGIHSGPVVAGVIGMRKFSYDLWGDTVNTASRMESHGVPGTVTVSGSMRERLGERYRFESLGPVQVKGKGEMELWRLCGRSMPVVREQV